jgi:hypothetical protein
MNSFFQDHLFGVAFRRRRKAYEKKIAAPLNTGTWPHIVHIPGIIFSNANNNKNITDQEWFQNFQSGLSSRRAEAANHRNIGNISKIGRLSPTQRLSPRGDFETTSNRSWGVARLLAYQ